MTAPAELQEQAGFYTDLGYALLRAPEGDIEAGREYVRLFLSPQGAACPPWQSVYSAEEGEAPRLMGQAHHRALEWFRRYGFEPAAKTEPADHAGLLLLFAAHLLRQGEPESIRQAFEREHLRWLSRFATKLRSAARLPAYEALGEALEDTFEPERG